MELKRIYAVCIIHYNQMYEYQMCLSEKSALDIIQNKYLKFITKYLNDIQFATYNGYEWTIETTDDCFKCGFVYDDIELESDGN